MAVSSNDLYVAYVCLGEHSVFSVIVWPIYDLKIGAIDANAAKEVNHVDIDSDEFNALFWSNGK